MIGILTWIGCGVVLGFIVNQLISASEKGLVLLTLGVAIAGAIAGGFVAQFFGHGNMATFSFYAILFAVCGATLVLVTYRRVIKV
jgi:uncharacterized membrane protein YeaQ/YmgE (transglycosylase-associated protein family)